MRGASGRTAWANLVDINDRKLDYKEKSDYDASETTDEVALATSQRQPVPDPREVELLWLRYKIQTAE